MDYITLDKLYYKDKENYEQIYENRFNSETTIKLGFNIGQYPAFVVMHPEILRLTTEILQKNTTLSAIANELVKSALDQYATKCLIDEIKLTNQIEGIHSTRKEIAELISGDIPKDKKRFRGLVNKYCMLLKNEDLPLTTCQDIRDVYNELVLEEVREDDPENVPDGQLFRKDSVSVLSDTGKELHRGILSESKIIELLTQGLNMLNNKDINPFIQIAVFHYLFGYVHPFYDGNGRTSRFISSYLLSKQLHYLVSVGLSSTIKNNISQYYKSFETTNHPNNRGEITAFVIMFLTIIKDTVSHIVDDLQEKKYKWDSFNLKIKILSGGDKTKEDILFCLLLNSLYGMKGLSISEIAYITKFSEPTVRNIIKDTGTQYFRIDKDGRKYLYDVDFDQLYNVQ